LAEQAAGNGQIASKNTVTSASKSYAATAAKKGNRNHRPEWVDELLLLFADKMRKAPIRRKKVRFQQTVSQPAAQCDPLSPTSHSSPSHTVDEECAEANDFAANAADTGREKDTDYKLAILESKLAAANSANELLTLKLNSAESNVRRCEEERDEAAAEASRLTAQSGGVKDSE